MPRPRIETGHRDHQKRNCRDGRRCWNNKGGCLEAQARSSTDAVRHGDGQGSRLLCHGIEKLFASLHRGACRVSRRRPCWDYLPQDSLMFIDESHQTTPQLRGMYHGDRSRKGKTSLNTDSGCRPRWTTAPLTFEEFEKTYESAHLCFRNAGSVRIDEGRRCSLSNRSSGRPDSPIRRWKSGPYAARSTILLNEIRKARREKTSVFW